MTARRRDAFDEALEWKLSEEMPRCARGAASSEELLAVKPPPPIMVVAAPSVAWRLWGGTYATLLLVFELWVAPNRMCGGTYAPPELALAAAVFVVARLE